MYISDIHLENYAVRTGQQTTIPKMHNSPQTHLSFVCFLLLCLWAWGAPLMMAKELIPIGVLLDLNSSIGSMSETSMSMALHDFYKHNAHYKTRLLLRKRDSKNDAVTAAYAALDLIKNEKVHAIVGPQTSEQAKFVIELGLKAEVPIISFSATSPSLSRTQNQYFIRTAQDDCFQVKAIAAVVKAYGWREIVPIYEDTEYGNGLIPYLTDALQAIDTRVPYRSVIDPRSNDIETQISKELNKLKGMLTKVFLVHMTAALGSVFFPAAEEAGMMSAGYGWIVTEGLSALLDPMVPKVMYSMQGVLGVRPRVRNTTRLEDFQGRWNASGKAKTAITLFGLWAYDSVWALATAVEKAGITNSAIPKKNVASKSRVDFVDLEISETGQRLLNQTLATQFPGLSGEFNLVNGQLNPSKLEIFNVIEESEDIIGYWTPGPRRGLSPYSSEADNFLAKTKLNRPKWPGNAQNQPPKLRIGIPVRPESQGINDFTKVQNFSFEVFLAVVSVLPFPLSHEEVPFRTGEPGGTYDEHLMQIGKNVDAVVGDVTIVANRSNYVDFTLPYSESSVSMVVSVKHDERQNMWIFLKPLSLGLWLTTAAAFILTGFVIWILEHRTNTEFRGSRNQQLAMIFWFSFSTLVFAHKEKVVNNWSRFVLIIWIFVVLIITQSYTASLASMLTVQRLQPTFMDVNEIINNNYSVGYHTGSFVKGFLIQHLGFEESKLKNYSSPEEYHQALSLGSKNGGVAAIFDEIFFVNIFLTKYVSRYKMVGPTYKTDGFGFAFPLKSPLVSYFSRAILNVTENTTKFESIKEHYFKSGIVPEDQSSSITSDSPSLTLESFGGLFIITSVTSLLSVLLNYMFKFPQGIQRSVWTPNPGVDVASLPAAATVDNQSEYNEEADDITLNEDHHILSPQHNDTDTSANVPHSS